MKVRLNGTRGTYPTSSENKQKYGGNTPCIEVINGEDRIIVDAGTGILEIDFDLNYNSGPINILLTHLHMDHIQGLAFCKPLFDPEKEVHIWAPRGSRKSLKSRLSRFLSPPFFPIPLRDIPAKLVINELPNTTFEIGNFVISSEYISHPGPTVAYRIECDDKTICFMPDHEPMIGKTNLYPEDEWVSGFRLAFQADLLIHDAQYEKGEYLDKAGWGHCSLDMAAEFCSRTKAKRLLMFHHDPLHTDDEITMMYENFLRASDYDFSIEPAIQGHEIQI